MEEMQFILHHWATEDRKYKVSFSSQCVTYLHTTQCCFLLVGRRTLPVQPFSWFDLMFFFLCFALIWILMRRCWKISEEETQRPPHCNARTIFVPLSLLWFICIMSMSRNYHHKDLVSLVTLTWRPNLNSVKWDLKSSGIRLDGWKIWGRQKRKKCCQSFLDSRTTLNAPLTGLTSVHLPAFDLQNFFHWGYGQWNFIINSESVREFVSIQ